jgi:UDP-N-acetyl-2-amino-2-deoxyglucuronate dehydrogenase
VAEKTLRVGIAGLGRVSGSHIQAYAAAPGARIVAVCDQDARVAKAAGERLGVTAYDDYERLLDDPEVDAVALLLPHEQHHSAAKEALAAGKHVCVEKPMAVDYGQCKELIALARENDLVLSVTHNTRFAVAYEAAKRYLDSGDLGDVHLIRVTMIGNEVAGYTSDEPRDAWRRERNGIGALMDDAVHYFYLLHWLAGDVRGVQAIGRNALPDMGVEDYVLVSGDFSRSGWFTVEIDLTAEITWQERLEIHGTKASLVIDHKQDPPVVLYEGSQNRTPTPVADVPYDPVDWRDASIAACVDDFIAEVLEGSVASVDLDDAAYAVRLVEKADESARAGGREIRV